MRLSILIAAYNRPEYLRQCLASVKAADLSQVQTVLIVDDKSSDPETIRLINDFELEGVELIKAFSKENRSIKGSLLFGLDLLFNSCDVVTNLDGDAIVRKDFIGVLLELQKTFPQYIITGFNCLTKNKNGSERHKVLTQGIGFNTKATVGGINMLFNKEAYREWVRPAIVECLKNGGNWDQKSCLNSGHPIVCAVPSVVQHIGIESAMGHSAGGEPPDVSTDFIDDRNVVDRLGSLTHNLTAKARIRLNKIQLPNVTLAAVDCIDLERVFKASDKCCEGIYFADVKIFSSLTTKEPRCENIIPIPKIDSKEAYSWWIMKELCNHITTSHILIFQHDGYVLNPSAWKDEWLQYDYIGAPWNWYEDDYKVGNGGFSLRSKKLMSIIAGDDQMIPATDGLNTHKEEDHCICRMYRPYLEEKYGIKFAPLEVAKQFSIEGWRSKNKTWTNEFGFHGQGLTNIKP